MDDQSLDLLLELSALRLTDAERIRISRSLDWLIEYVELLYAKPIEEVDPLIHAVDHSQQSRPDVATQVSAGNLLETQTNHHRDGLYLVPKVIDT